VKTVNTFAAALDALAGARHPDPFSILGPHIVDGRVVVRALLPGAESVSVVAAGSAIAMHKVHPAGIYEAEIAGASVIPDYRLRVVYADHRSVDVDDPYRYGRVIGDYDLYLFGEGTHSRIYDRLGAHPMTIGETRGVHFAVWAPNASRVSVVGDFNGWDGRVHPML
jgi:1,4-alpha-glucan branching enzyme